MEERSQRCPRGGEGKDAKNLEFGECRDMVLLMLGILMYVPLVKPRINPLGSIRILMIN